ncbi:MAG TPA: hypothetical protein IAB22_08435 [Candidatus Merdivicinus intestinavium]|nr:hypothetical protein [Candidatus Merdivicinus intestinavium]
MGALVAYGAALAVGIAAGLVLTVVGLFFGHIILFDSIFLAVITGIVCSQVWGIHTAICLLISAALFAFLFWLQKTRAGFWIIGLLLSAFWAFVFGFLAYAFSGEDMVWFYVVMGLGFVLMVWLHLWARDK